MPPEPIFRHAFRVPDTAIDGNGHVNNVAIVQWMQDVAVLHSDSVGCTAATVAAGHTWVVRSHHVEYLRPAFDGDQIEIVTWIADFRRVRSRRRYEFYRRPGDELIARGETDWVYVNVATGRPGSVPPEVQRCFSLGPAE